MLTFSKHITQNHSQRRLLIFVVLFLLCSVGMFGQQTETKSSGVVFEKKEIQFSVSQEVASVSDSQLDFMGWFMGTKQNQSANENVGEKSSSALSAKKQILSSGITPNKVLYRTFVKRILSKDVALA